MAGDGQQNVVTGAFSYTGKYITRRLLALEETVRTLTGHPDRPSPFGDRVPAFRLQFDDRKALVESLRGATTLFNTYWIRFPYGNMTYAKAVKNTKTLIQAAKEAGLRKMVHVSIANPSEDLPLPYYREKAVLEEAIVQSGLSYAILRPTVIFGPEDILINNIAWFLRKFPVFAVPGSGEYRLQPIFVEDMAGLAVHLAHEAENTIVDAVGPEVYTFNELVRLIADRIGRKAWIIHVPPGLALLFLRLVGWMVKDVVLTRDEIKGLMKDLLVTRSPPAGPTRLSEWLSQNAQMAGRHYASEVGRHFR